MWGVVEDIDANQVNEKDFEGYRSVMENVPLTTFDRKTMGSSEAVGDIILPPENSTRASNNKTIIYDPRRRSNVKPLLTDFLKIYTDRAQPLLHRNEKYIYGTKNVHFRVIIRKKKTEN